MKKIIYLNDAATAWPKAPGVREAVSAAIEEIPDHPGRAATESADVADECRELLAEMLSCDSPDRIALTSNATHSLNLAVWGVDLKPGDHVITSVAEHNSVLRPLFHLRDRIGLRITVIGLDERGRIDEEAFDEVLRAKPRLIAFIHASNVTGRVNDVGPLFEKARAAGAVTLLDASQSLGHVPVSVSETNADMVAFTGHKGPRGPTGTGGLYVAPDLELAQFYVGGTGIKCSEAVHPPEMPIRLEAGTPNMVGFAGLAVALKWLRKAGPAFRRTEERLGKTLRDGLRSIPGVTIYDDFHDADRVAITSFAMDGWDIKEAGVAFAEQFGIVCRTGFHCAPLIHKAIDSSEQGTIRFSVSGFNADDEIAFALNAVRSLAKTC